MEQGFKHSFPKGEDPSSQLILIVECDENDDKLVQDNQKPCGRFAAHPVFQKSV